ncbi:MAG: hypothetical protein L0216_09715 [Planctomycetales bacterium]|nr:hypothetical protein [Planctomycetales bacterium]
MHAFKARVVKGYLVLRQRCPLPEGTVLDLTVADPGDDLTPAERKALHVALDRAWRHVKSGGKLIPAESLLRKLGSRG